MSLEQPEFDPLIDQEPARYIVGIDLGTTNCAVSFVDSQLDSWTVETFSVPQLVGPSVVESRETLPSFHFQPARTLADDDSLKLPWLKKKATHCVGVMARDESVTTPGRGISSAKSWLCHPGVDRRAALLPWHAADDVKRLSPVQATASYLDHIRKSWNHKFAHHPLEEQDVVITLPASFDEVARELTIEAAANAKLKRVLLIEEPQAAFYAWVYKHADDWEQQISVGQKILVCDIGGGTSDFTLIRARASEAENEKVQFHRVAVGNHLILGGDNLDLALAKHVEQKLTSDGKLSPRQWDVLVGSARQCKETLLSGDAPKQSTINLPGSGSKLIGGSLQATVGRDEVVELLVDGFLPDVKLNSKPVKHASGFQELGLPYAADPAITTHLADFLTSHRDAEQLDETRPDVVLFNGGFFASELLRQKVVDAITGWFSAKDTDWQPIVLENDRLDQAVARGAAYYGMVRRGEGVKIAASLARSYYIGFESESSQTPQAICLVPGDAEPGQDFELAERTFQLTISQPVEFSLYSSSTRLSDQPGQVVDVDVEQMKSLPPIRTVLRAESRNEKRDISVRLRVHLSEIGTIELSCQEVDSERSWKLQFDIRSTTQTEMDAHTSAGESQGFVSEDVWDASQAVIESVFSKEKTVKPRELMNLLAESLNMPREEWPMSLLRRIWESLMELEPQRRLSAAHEARWLNLLGYALRPGYGFAVDDWRVTETWRTINGKLAHRAPEIRRESLILWRRIAGGLSRGQQISVADQLLSSIRGLHRQLTGKKGTGATLRADETIEIWRLLGSLELLTPQQKIEIGTIMCDLLNKPSMKVARDAMIWTLGRIGQRVPQYGPLNTVVQVLHLQPWIDLLLKNAVDQPVGQLALVQMTRLTNDRYRDIDPQTRETVLAKLELASTSEHLQQIVREGGNFDAEEQGRVFGEALPKGLRLE